MKQLGIKRIILKKISSKIPHNLTVKKDNNFESQYGHGLWTREDQYKWLRSVDCRFINNIQRSLRNYFLFTQDWQDYE